MIKHALFSNFVCDPWQETFADAGDGDVRVGWLGVGGLFGTIWDYLKTILGPFWINFKTILNHSK